MTVKSSNKVETNRYELVVEIDGQTFMNEVNAVYKKKAKNITVPGFRKGKAPKAVIERQYGEGVFYEDAIKNLYPKAVVDAAEEVGLDFVKDDMDLEVEKADKEGLLFKCVITVEPETSIEGYKGITYKKLSEEVSPDEVEAEIKKVLDRNSRAVAVSDRPAQKGDITVIDFEGFLDGKAFDGGKAEQYSLTLGSGQFIPGFEEQLEGHNAGEEFSIQVKFPDEYQAEELAGKETEFKIKLHEIKAKEFPDFDDDFVKDISEFETVDEYKTDVRKNLEKKKADEAKRTKDSQISEKLAQLLKAEIPEAMITNRVDDMIDELEMQLKTQGLDVKTYMNYTGVTYESLAERYHDSAEENVKVTLALKKIAQLEGITVSDEDIENKYKELADTYKIDIEKAKNVFNKKDVESDMKILRALDIVMDNAVEADESDIDAAEVSE